MYLEDPQHNRPLNQEETMLLQRFHDLLPPDQPAQPHSGTSTMQLPQASILAQTAKTATIQQPVQQFLPQGLSAPMAMLPCMFPQPMAPQPMTISPKPMFISPQHQAMPAQPMSMTPHQQALPPQPVMIPHHQAMPPQHMAMTPHHQTMQPMAMTPHHQPLPPQPMAMAPHHQAQPPQPMAMSAQPMPVQPAMMSCSPPVAATAQYKTMPAMVPTIGPCQQTGATTLIRPMAQPGLIVPTAPVHTPKPPVHISKPPVNNLSH